jgi:CheY-like chemotaxis protein
MLRRILFLEERQEVQSAVSVLLRTRGFEVVTASTVPEALPNLDSSDGMIMTVSGGTIHHAKSLLERLREQTWKPAIAITGSVMPHQIEQLRTVGFDRVIPEPLDVHRLVEELKSFSS